MAEQTFEKSLKRLETIVQEMESGEVDLDAMLKKYEEGMKLATFCMKKLDTAEKKIEVLVRNQDQSLDTAPFEPQDSNGSQSESAPTPEEPNNEPDLF